MRLRWARSATRHRIGKARSRYIIEHAGLRFRYRDPDEGDAMPLRQKYRAEYEEARRWRV